MEGVEREMEKSKKGKKCTQAPISIYPISHFLLPFFKLYISQTYTHNATVKHIYIHTAAHSNQSSSFSDDDGEAAVRLFFISF
jgi:hypothetical protein